LELSSMSSSSPPLLPPPTYKNVKWEWFHFIPIPFILTKPLKVSQTFNNETMEFHTYYWWLVNFVLSSLSYVFLLELSHVTC
jgi:hypothetical protein